MRMYDALILVAKSADQMKKTNALTDENRDAAVIELENLIMASKSAIQLGASRFDIVQAVTGSVPDYLKEQ